MLLLDGCCRADIGLIKQFITQTLNRHLTDLNLIVVTHMHPDHAGAAHKLRALTGCKIASAKMPTQWYRGMNGRFMHAVDISLGAWVAHRMKRPKKNLWYPPHLIVDFPLVDQDLLPGFEDWSVVSTPGHTDRDISVLHKESKRIYVADLMVKVKDRFIPPIPVNYPNQYRASLHKLHDLKPNSVMLAHGAEVELSDKDYDHLFTVAPSKPFTVWTPARKKMKRLLLRKRN